MSTLYTSARNERKFDMVPDEKIGVRKVRIKRLGTFSTTIVQSVARADTLLVDWQRCANGKIDCEFEVTFVDGYVIKGNIDFGQKKIWQASLSRQLDLICTNLVPPCSGYFPSGEPSPRFFDLYEFDA